LWHDAQFESVLLAQVGAGHGHVIKACVTVHAFLWFVVACGLFGLVVPVFIGKYFLL
jgi:hypothetical protein